jgi:hypothetical protein
MIYNGYKLGLVVLNLTELVLATQGGGHFLDPTPSGSQDSGHEASLSPLGMGKNVGQNGFDSQQNKNRNMHLENRRSSRAVACYDKRSIASCQE